jgi:hypothetical protein
MGEERGYMDEERGYIEEERGYMEEERGYMDKEHGYMRAMNLEVTAFPCCREPPAQRRSNQNKTFP